MGPTYLAIPEDILTADVDARCVLETFQEPLSSRPLAREVERAAELLASANFPLILAGSQVAQEGAIEQVVRLATELGAPVCCENRVHMAGNAYPTEEPHFVGPFQPGADFVQRADVILALGCKLFVGKRSREGDGQGSEE